MFPNLGNLYLTYDLFQEYTKDYKSLILNPSNNDKENIEDQVFWYKISPTPENEENIPVWNENLKMIELIDMPKKSANMSKQPKISTSSPPLEFKPKIEADISNFEEMLEDPNLPAEVRAYYEGIKQETINKTNTMNQEIHAYNAQELALRVIHKYQKWDEVRFGSTPETQLDFYDGSSKIDSTTNSITFDPIFKTLVEQEAIKAKLNPSQILDNLHLGYQCSLRFQDFIKVPNKDPYLAKETKKACPVCLGYH